jgi:hypothetical protein
MVMFSDEHEQLPPLHPRRGRETCFHGPTPPGVSIGVEQSTPSSRLQQGRPSLPLQPIYGPWPGRVGGQLDGTLRTHGPVDGDYHWQ